jgi:hypothetical protein
MRARLYDSNGSLIVNGRMRGDTVETPHITQHHRSRPGHRNGSAGEPQTTDVDSSLRRWRRRCHAMLRTETGEGPVSGGPSVLVTIGHRTCLFHAFVTVASIRFDAPSTITLCVSTLADLTTFAAPYLGLGITATASPARLILVDAMELTWQRARYREAGHRLMPVDRWLVGTTALQRWLWRRLQTTEGSGST